MTTYPDIRVRKCLTDRYDVWETVEDCRAGEMVIPAGFQTDLASIPQALWWLLPPYGKAANAAILHDFRYVNCTYADITSHTRARTLTDLFFYQDMVRDGVPGWQAWLMYQAVRWFGRGHWVRNMIAIENRRLTEPD